jgi:uncharacterized protein HemX
MTPKQLALFAFYIGLAGMMMFFVSDMVENNREQQAAASIKECETTNEQRKANNEERQVRRDYLIQYAHLLTMRAQTDAAAGDKSLARQDLLLARNAMDWHAKIIDAKLIDCDQLYHGG